MTCHGWFGASLLVSLELLKADALALHFWSVYVAHSCLQPAWTGSHALRLPCAHNPISSPVRIQHAKQLAYAGPVQGCSPIAWETTSNLNVKHSLTVIASTAKSRLHVGKKTPGKFRPDQVTSRLARRSHADPRCHPRNFLVGKQ